MINKFIIIIGTLNNLDQRKAGLIWSDTVSSIQTGNKKNITKC